MTDHTSYAELEKQHLAGAAAVAGDMTPGAMRISARIQAGFNYAMGQEVMTQGEWNINDTANGLAHATFCSWLSLVSASSVDVRERLTQRLRDLADEVDEAADDPDEHRVKFGAAIGSSGGRA